MNLENLANLAEVIGVFAIFVSLVFLAVQNRQSQKQMERANQIARAEFSGKIRSTNIGLLSQLVEDGELGLAFRQLVMENKRIEDEDTLFRLITWFFNYSVLWMDTVSADEKGLVDEEIFKIVSGAQAFHLSIPIVWDSTVRALGQRVLDTESLDKIMSQMVTLRDKAKARKWDAAKLFAQQREAQDASADMPSEAKEEPRK
jgi:hypothetical protein